MANKMNFTPEQEQAITSNFPGNALVSASAGSGKTRVLVQRVLNKINQGVNVDELLIVTFTKAAAKEMRERIKKGLQDEINTTKDAEKKRNLVTQMRKLSVAHISTMDAFCQWLVQKYYYAIDLDPNFRLLTDQTETEMLRDSVWKDLREDLYGKDDDGSFSRLTRNFSNERSDDGLTNVVFKTYDFSEVKKNPDEWLNNLTKFYQVGTKLTQSTVFQQQLLPEIQNKVNQSLTSLRQAEEVASDAGIVKMADNICKDISNLEKLLHDLETKTWDELYTEFNNFKFQRTSVGKIEEDAKASKEQATKLRDEGKKTFTEKVVKNYFFADEKDNINVINQSEKLVKKLVEVIQMFSKKYDEVKKQKHAFEFIDVEHFALDILTQDTKSSHEIQNQFQNYFKEIMVDEYQDNNRLQDAILNAMNNPKHNDMFMVGDVKQSIYRFRLADPSMFLTKLEDYQKDDNQNTAIILADNFRSAKNVDDFTNLIFEQTMDKGLGELNYTGNAKLKFGANYPENMKSNADMMLYVDDEDPNAANTLQVQNNSEGQVEMIAQKIQNLISQKFQIYDKKLNKMRDIRFGDIAILAPTRNNNFNISKVFAKHQIPVSLDGSQSYFKTTEVQIMMSLLQIIDNPYQDIPLAAVLRSPIVGMDENEMAYLRINRKTGDYFSSLLNFYKAYPNTQKPTDFGTIVYKKIDIFLKQLKGFKNYAIKHELADLIWNIYETTGFLDYVGGMPAGEKRVANLHALYERAAEYEKSSFKGLFAFVQFVKRLQDKDEDLGEASSETDQNSVNVMTIHGSKGLEFPVVFLTDVTHNFNTLDFKNKYIFNDNLGIGIKYFDQQHHEIIPTLQYLAILASEKDKMLSEEMRQLYVALTRAEQQLFITGIVKNKKPVESETKKWEQSYQSDGVVLNRSVRSNANNFMDWIGTSISRHPNYFKEFGKSGTSDLFNSDPTNFKVEFIDPNDLKTHQNKRTILSQKINDDTKNKSFDQNKIANIMDFVYPYNVATNTTAYQSVSEIKRLFDDPDNITLGSATESKNMVLKKSRYNNKTFAQPEFLQTVMKPNSMEIGTATHLVLQKINVKEAINEKAVKNLINILVDEHLLTPEIAKEINVDSIIKFYESDLGKLIKANPDKLYREIPFSLIISADAIFSEFKNDTDQKLLIHGIIDGYLDFEDGTVLFDYKTDYVNPKNPTPDIKKIADNYRGQINMYSIALSDMLGKPVKDKYLYMLSNDHLQKIE